MNIDRLLNQTATYWVKTGNDGFGGPTWSSPTEIDVRWEYRNELFKDDEGVEHTSTSIVYMTDVLSIGDYLYEGSSSASDPTTVNTAYEIKQVNKTPSVDASQELVKVYISG